MKPNSDKIDDPLEWLCELEYNQNIARWCDRWLEYPERAVSEIVRLAAKDGLNLVDEDIVNALAEYRHEDLAGG